MLFFSISSTHHPGGLFKNFGGVDDDSSLSAFFFHSLFPLAPQVLLKSGINKINSPFGGSIYPLEYIFVTGTELEKCNHYFIEQYYLLRFRSLHQSYSLLTHLTLRGGWGGEREREREREREEV